MNIEHREHHEWYGWYVWYVHSVRYVWYTSNMGTVGIMTAMRITCSIGDMIAEYNDYTECCTQHVYYAHHKYDAYSECAEYSGYYVCSGSASSVVAPFNAFVPELPSSSSSAIVTRHHLVSK